MKYNLPNQLHEADKFVQNPFVIFEIHNFMDDSDYDALVKEIKYCDEYNYIEGTGGKKRPHIQDQIWDKLNCLNSKNL